MISGACIIPLRLQRTPQNKDDQFHYYDIYFPLLQYFIMIIGFFKDVCFNTLNLSMNLLQAADKATCIIYYMK